MNKPIKATIVNHLFGSTVLTVGRDKYKLGQSDIIIRHLRTEKEIKPARVFGWLFLVALFGFLAGPVLILPLVCLFLFSTDTYVLFEVSQRTISSPPVRCKTDKRGWKLLRDFAL